MIRPCILGWETPKERAAETGMSQRLARVGNPRFYRHPYQSPQQELWQPGDVEWFVIIRHAPPVRRRKRKSRLVLMQLPLLLDGTEE